MTRGWSIRGKRVSGKAIQAGEAVRTTAGGVRPNGLFQSKQEGGVELRAGGR